MKPFLFYVEQNDVRRCTPDPVLATSLEKEARQRLAFLKTLPLTDESAPFVLEGAYDVLRMKLEAALARKGYKSYSHVATLAYARDEKLLTEAEFVAADRLREVRNQSKYYARRVGHIEAEDARKRVLLFFNRQTG